MYMRLAFSVAINVDADVLLIDEILAVGDANFQAKCFNKLREIKAKGCTIVIVSHAMGQIEQICDRTIWIHEGVIREQGKPRVVHPMYLDYMGQKREEIAEKEAARLAAKEAKERAEREAAEAAQQEAAQRAAQEEAARQAAEQEAAAQAAAQAAAEQEAAQAAEESEQPQEQPKRWGNGKARITKIELFDKDGKKKSVFKTGTDITIKLHYDVFEKVEDAIIGIGVFRSDGMYCYGTNTRIDKLEEFNLEKSGVAELQLKDVMLLPGLYTLDFAIECDLNIPVDYFREAVSIEFYSMIDDVGMARIKHDWNI